MNTDNKRTLPRFYYPEALSIGDLTLTHSQPIVRHLHVLRLNTGDSVILFNGCGGEHHAVIKQVDKRTIELHIDRYYPVSRESPLELTIVQALCAADRMDYAVQKATECGVQFFQPIIATRSQHRLTAAQADKKVAHWQGIAIAASEQCGRTVVPRVLPIQQFSDYMTLERAAVNLLLSPTRGCSIDELPKDAHSIQMLIGPEGGFTEREENQAINGGFTALSIGPRIFRAETITPVLAGLLQYKYGDYKLYTSPL